MIAPGDDGGTSDVEYVVEYDYPEGCEEKNDRCDIKRECGSDPATDPITHEPIEVPFFRATYYTKDNEGDPDTRGKKIRGECVNVDSLRDYYAHQERHPYTLPKSLMNVDSVFTALPPVLTDAQILTRRLVAYIDDPTPYRLEEIERKIKGVDPTGLASTIQRPHEEGEEDILRLYDTLLDHFFDYHHDKTIERCEALEKIIALLVETYGVPYQKGDHDDEWNDTDFFHSLYYETRDEKERSDVSEDISREVYACLERIKQMIQGVSVQPPEPTETDGSMVYK